MENKMSEKYGQWDDWSAKMRDMNSKVWEGHTSEFEDVTHVIGGMGLGFLVYSVFGKWARPIGFTLLVLSAGLHIWALMTAQPGWGMREKWTEMRAKTPGMPWEKKREAA